MPAPDRETLRSTFDEVADLYDAVRPGYPDALFDDLVELAGLDRGARLLEVGCGTGQATLPLARRGLEIVCVELGENLSAVARRNLAAFPAARVETAPFEAWNDRGERFSLVLAATSWKWIDPEVRYVKVARVLEPSGALAIVGTEHVLPPGGDLFFREIQDAYEAIGEGDDSCGPPLPDDVVDERADIEASGLFGDVEVRRYVWARPYTADEYIAVLDTYSGHRSMDPASRDWLYREIRRRVAQRAEPVVRKHYLNILHVARRTTGAAPPGIMGR